MKQAMKIVTFNHLYPSQIEQASQNLQDVAIQSFFPKTSYKRFKSHVQSILFTLNHVKEESERLCQKIAKSIFPQFTLYLLLSYSIKANVMKRGRTH